MKSDIWGTFLEKEGDALGETEKITAKIPSINSDRMKYEIAELDTLTRFWRKDGNLLSQRNRAYRWSDDQRRRNLRKILLRARVQ